MSDTLSLSKGEWKETDFGRIPNDWDLKKIIELKANEKSALAMGPFGSNIKAENFVPVGVPVIRGTNLNYSKYVDGNFVFLTEEKADELSSSNCKPGDIVFTHRGTIGQVGLIPEGKYPRYVISQSGMKLSVNKDLISPDFLFYFFKSVYGQHQLLKSESQVGVPSISNPLTSLKAIQVPVPSLPEQLSIASILSSLDNKIDLLHSQNKTLEQLAETLFRQWFVLEEHEDWEEKSLDQIADYLNGLACQKYPPLDEINKLPVIKIKDIKNGFSDNSDWVTSNVPQKYIIERGDILFSWSGSLEVMIWAYGKGVLNQHLFKVTSVEYPKWLYYFATKLHLDDFRVIAESKSTTMGHIQREHLSAAKIKIPNDENILKQMDNTFSPLINKIIINFDQIDSLTKMRDTLLPKLMSGEIRVRE